MPTQAEWDRAKAEVKKQWQDKFDRIPQSVKDEVLGRYLYVHGTQEQKDAFDAQVQGASLRVRDYRALV